jgi:4-amino-4-deoxy-L-arabinose transferase-like glycosyltransferase
MTVKSFISQKNLPFWVFSLGIFSLFVLPYLFADGMFLDGVIYATISRNLAIGEGSMWFPVLTRTLFNPFYEHPPLVFWIQSVFFRIMGDHLFVERFYSFLTGLITMGLMVKAWQIIWRENKTMLNLSWLPVLLWSIIPVNTWAFRNDLLENTMGIFTLMAIILIMKILRSEKQIYTFAAGAGIMVFLAALSKGFVALFPLAAPLLAWLVFRKRHFQKMAASTFFIILVPVVLLTILMLFPDAHQNLMTYFHIQVFKGITGQTKMVNTRWISMIQLFMELLPILLLTGTVLIYCRLKKLPSDAWNSDTLKWALFLVMVGLSASLPLTISLKQSRYYLVPSFPYFALAGAVFIAPYLGQWVNHVNASGRKFKTYRYVSILFLAGVLVFSTTRYGTIGRNADELIPMYKIGAIVPRCSTVSICPSMWTDWNLHAYYYRYFRISLESDQHHRTYFLRELRNNCMVPDQLYQKIPLKMVDFELYRLSPH